MATWNEILKLTKTNGITNRYAAPAPVGVTYATGRHGGVDMVLKNDNVPSFSSGTVVRTKTGDTGFGNYVVVKDNRGFYNYYAHLNSISVKEGQKVNEGDILGIQGETGQAKGKHLHLEVRSNMSDNKSTVNPVTHFAKNPDSWGNRLDDKITGAEMNGTAPWTKEAIEERNSFLKNMSLGFLVKAGFVLGGVFCIYVAITKGLFGGSGE